MATVPFSANRNGQPSAPMPMPSEENLLMAAAIMHQQGKFQPQGEQVAANVLPIRSQASLDRAIKNADSDEELQSIANRLKRRGMSTDSPAFAPGTLKEK